MRVDDAAVVDETGFLFSNELFFGDELVAKGLNEFVFGFELAGMGFEKCGFLGLQRFDGLHLRSKRGIHNAGGINGRRIRDGIC